MTEVQGIVKVEEETIKIENVNTKETATLKKNKKFNPNTTIKQY